MTLHCADTRRGSIAFGAVALVLAAWLAHSSVPGLAQTGGALFACEGEGLIAKNSDAGKRSILSAKVEEVRIRERVQLRNRPLFAGIGHADGEELLRLWKWKRLKEQRIDHAENGGVRADAESQRKHGDDCERRVLNQLTQSILNVL